MPSNDIQVACDVPALLGECPLWHPKEEALYWIDIAGHAVHRLRPVSREHSTWPLPSEPGCIAWCENGGLIVPMRSGVAMLDTTSGMLTPVAAAPYDPSKFRFNDGRCDAQGRLWAGTLFDSREHPRGTLYCIERGVICDAHKPATVSNGVAFSLDSRKLYHTDTTAHRIMEYDFDLASGTADNARVFMQFSSDKAGNYGGRPDGAAVDSEGAYWCAMYEGGRLLRISPEGNILREVILPVCCPTMIAFGGTDLRTLYITTVRHKRPEEELQRHPMSGFVLSMEVDVPGTLEHAYIP